MHCQIYKYLSLLATVLSHDLSLDFIVNMEITLSDVVIGTSNNGTFQVLSILLVLVHGMSVLPNGSKS